MKTYFIQDTLSKKVKIGRSKDPQKRLLQLQTGHPNRLHLLVVIDGDHEQRLHTHFAKHHVRGEWFDLTEELRGFVTRSKKHGAVVHPPIQDGAVMSYAAHERVMRNVYARARLAASITEMPINPPIDNLPMSDYVLVKDHHAHLARARQAYGLTPKK